MIRLRHEYGIQIGILEIAEGCVRIQGSFFRKVGYDPEMLSDWRLVCRIGLKEEEHPLAVIGDCEDSIDFAGKRSKGKCLMFECSFPLPASQVFRLGWRTADGRECIPWQDVDQGRFSPFPFGLPAGYAVFSGLLARSGHDYLEVEPASWTSVFRATCVFALRAFGRWPKSAAKALCLRAAVWMFGLLHRSPIWLFSDRVEKADDNGRALFEHCAALPRHPGSPECVFAIDRHSSDAKDLAKVGRIVNISGLRYKLYYLRASFHISAYHTGVQRLPFSRRVQQCLKPLLARHRFVYLKHGILKDDMSRVLGKERMNARLLVSAAKREYESFFEWPYGYLAREVKLCGMARYDKLENRSGRNITIMPTWRQYLVERKDLLENVLLPGFENSTYCTAYRRLFHDERLKAACARLGYGIRLMMHPNMRFSLQFFSVPSHIEILSPNVRYRDVFATSGIVLTDFSSVFFDVAYLKKALVFFQPDKEEFFANQYDKGYFDYERDGFGEVEYTVEGIIDRLIEYMERDAKMKPEYVRRVDEFFAFTDKNNCKRIYEAILKADAEDRADRARA